MSFKYTPDDLDQVFKTTDDSYTNIPATIELADGRRFSVRELYASISASQVSNRLKLLKINQPRPPRRAKRRSGHYTPEERMWMITHTIDEVMTRFSLSRTEATGAKTQQEYRFRQRHGIQMLAQVKGMAGN